MIENKVGDITRRQFLADVMSASLSVVSIGAAATTDGTRDKKSCKKTFTLQLDLPDLAKPLEMALIPAGSFKMGCSLNAFYRIGREWLPHEVHITKPFYMGKYEITQAQWKAVMSENPVKGPAVGDNYPVYNINWNVAQKFINRLNSLGQGKFRLPTEAEWEYACKAGTETRFFFGDVPDCGFDFSYSKKADEYMWWGGNTRNSDSPKGPREVGLKKPNPHGLYDIHGNVWELCQDSLVRKLPSFKEGEVRINPVERKSTKEFLMKGGAWSSPGIHTSSVDRTGGIRDRDDYGDYVGIRLVRE